ncbi:HvfC/BufC N-terminal domain-containing protein [Wenyingzhuangia sp. IMCC45467]
MLLAKTHQHQTNLATYCRTGNPIEIEGAVQKNLTHYRRLVFNNVLDSLETAYPLTEKLLGKEKWELLVNRFFSNYDIQSPQIWKMPEEFKNYILKHEPELTIKYPLLENLLNFEWLEVEIFMMMDITAPKPLPNTFILNPEMDMIRVDYPVHLKNPNLITKADIGTYFICMHRNPDTGNVQFTNLSIPFVDVLEKLSAKPLTETEIKNILQKYASDELVNTAFNNFIQQSLSTKLLFT